MRKLNYWMLALALSALMPFGLLAQGTAEGHAFKVALHELDKDTPVGGDYHKANLALREVSAVSSVLYDGEAGAFYVFADNASAHAELQRNLEGFASVAPISDAQYEAALRAVAAQKLSETQSGYFANEPGFPARNGATPEAYREKIAQWLKTHPDKLEELR